MNNVIYQISSYYPPHVGGMESFVKNLSEELSQRGRTVSVITSDVGVNNFTIKTSKKNLKVKYLKSTEVLNTPLIPSLHTELSKAPPSSVFHLHIAQAFVPEMTYFVARNRKIPLVSHIHLDVGNSTIVGKYILPIYKKIFLSKVLKSSSKVIVQTDDYKDLIREKYNISEAKIAVIPNGIVLAAQNKNRFEDITPPYKILFVGRLVNQKRADIFINAIKILIEEDFPITVEIVGDGEERNVLVELAKDLKLENIIQFTGFLNTDKVKDKYIQASCLVQTSDRESFSTVLLESLNYGCPIVSSDISGTRNFLQDKKNALLVKNTPSAVAQAIRLLMENNELRKKIIKEGYKTVRNYSWEKVVDEIELIYCDLF